MKDTKNNLRKEGMWGILERRSGIWKGTEVEGKMILGKLYDTIGLCRGYRPEGEAR